MSATLISPVLADDFVPLRYYEAEPLPIIQTKPNYPYEERISANTMGVRGLYGGNTTIDSGIRQAILKGDIIELELLLNEKAVSQSIIAAIVAAVEKGDTFKAIEILETEVPRSVRDEDDYEWCREYCLSQLNQNGDPTKDRQAFPYTNCLKQCLGRMI